MDNRLHELIQSLTKNEKRYFTLSANKKGGEKNYLQIFSQLEKSATPDIAKLKQRFTNYDNAARYLYDAILKSMRDYHSKTFSYNILLDNLADVQFLIEKNLYKQALSQIKTGIELAAYNEYYALQIEFLDAQQYVYRKLGNTEDAESTYSQILKLLETQKNLIGTRVHENKVVGVYYKYGTTKNKMAQTKLKSLNKILETKKTFSSVGRINKIVKYNSSLLAGFATEDYPMASKISDLIMGELEGWQKSDYYKKKHSSFFLNHIAAKINNNEFANAKTIINDAKLEYTRDKSPEAYIKLLSYEIEICINDADVEQGLVVATDLIKILNETPGIVPDRIVAYITATCILMYRIANDYKNALQTINLFLQSATKKYSEDVVLFAKLFYLLLHFEQGNATLVEYHARATLRYLKTNGDKDLLAHELINFLKNNAYEISNEKLMAERYANLKLALQKNNAIFLNGAFNFNWWIDSKITGKPLSAIIAEGKKTK
jgi:hypothetical protein